jgi:cytidine deaminase
MSDPLLKAAVEARSRAYAPYSGYLVGAAVEAEDGSIYGGCNVENISYGLTICAERGAISRMVAEGRTRLRRVAVVTADAGTPCGMCLQTLLEFAEDPGEVEVVTSDPEGGRAELPAHGAHSPRLFLRSGTSNGTPSQMSHPRDVSVFVRKENKL